MLRLLFITATLITLAACEDRGSATNQTPAFEEDFLDAGS